MRAWLLAFFGAFSLCLCLAHGNLDNSDATMTMHAARALWLRGDSGLRGPDQQPQWRGEAQIVAHISAEAAAGRHAYGKRGQNGLTYLWFPMGHVWLMVPPVALGELLERKFPGVEQRFQQVAAGSPQSIQFGQFVLSHALLAMLLPPLVLTTALLLLFALGRALGASRVDAAIAAAAIACTSQLFPLGRESLSDGPGVCFLLAALLAAVRYHRGQLGVCGLLVGGAMAGAAVLTRYQHGLVVPVLLWVVARAALQRRRLLDLGWLALGGLPALMCMLLVNHARFGSVGDTGYPPFSSWFNYPPWFGLVKLLFAAGKGILWFSPLLWLVVPACWRRRRDLQLPGLAMGLLLVPLLMFSSTSGWQSGQCWGARYVTPGIVALLGLLLPQLRPWRSSPRRFWALAVFGLLVNLTSVIAPTRGHTQLAAQGVAAYYDRQLAAGLITPADRAGVDLADHFFFLPRFSPLHTNWTYAVRSGRGDFEEPDGRPRHGSANTIEPLFGVAAAPGQEANQGLAPLHWEDRSWRHLWWVFWAAMTGWPAWLLVMPFVGFGLACSWFGWRGLLRDPQA